MIYDGFSFFNELDVLEIRLNTLCGVVDKFVLVEAAWTHTGKPKPLYFEENKTRYAPFLDKIIHVVVSDADLPPFPAMATEREKAWIRENVQRNAVVKGLVGAKPDDVLVISDLDEIPDPGIVKTEAARPNGITNLNLRNYAFYLNNRNISFPNWAGGPQLLSYGTFRNLDVYRNFRHTEYAPECANVPPSATIIRFAKKQKSSRTPDGTSLTWAASRRSSINRVRFRTPSSCSRKTPPPAYALRSRRDTPPSDRRPFRGGTAFPRLSEVRHGQCRVPGAPVS